MYLLVTPRNIVQRHTCLPFFFISPSHYCWLPWLSLRARKYLSGKIYVVRRGHKPLIIYVRLFKTEKRLEEFYSLLIKESLDREDVNSLEKENVRDLHEIRQAFRNRNNCYKSYLYR